MALRDRLRRLTRQAEEAGVLIRQRDGSVRVFDVMDVDKDMFLAQYRLVLGESYPSEVLDAVRNATPESKVAFEERFGSIAMTGRIIAAEYQGGWIEEYRLLEDGTVEKIYYEGGSPEAQRIREEARSGHQATSG
jgi:hypothetical protein